MRISDWSSDVCSSDLTRASRWSIRLSWALPRRAARTSAATTTAARTTTASRRSSASDPLALPDHEKPRFGGAFFGSSPKSGERRHDLEEEVGGIAVAVGDSLDGLNTVVDDFAKTGLHWHSPPAADSDPVWIEAT